MVGNEKLNDDEGSSKRVSHAKLKGFRVLPPYCGIFCTLCVNNHEIMPTPRYIKSSYLKLQISYNMEKSQKYEIRFTGKNSQFLSDFRILNARAARFDFSKMISQFFQAKIQLFYACNCREADFISHAFCNAVFGTIKNLSDIFNNRTCAFIHFLINHPFTPLSKTCLQINLRKNCAIFCVFSKNYRLVSK